MFIRSNNSVHLFLRAAAFLTAVGICELYAHYSTHMKAKWQTQSADTSANKHGSHKLNVIETNMEIIRHVESGESLASIGRLLNLFGRLYIQLLRRKKNLRNI